MQPFVRLLLTSAGLNDSLWKVRFLWIKSKKIAENTKNEPCTLKNDHEKIAPRCARDS